MNPCAVGIARGKRNSVLAGFTFDGFPMWQLRVTAAYSMHEKLIGSLSDLILKEAKEWKSDIIVLGTHGNTGIKHLLLGSNAEDIARSSRIPVLLIHSASANSASA